MTKRPILTALAILLLIATVWTSYQWYDIKRVGSTTEPVPADVAIILGMWFIEVA